MTSATVRASSASSLCPLRRAGRSASTLKSCSSPSSPHQCSSLRLKVWQLLSEIVMCWQRLLYSWFKRQECKWVLILANVFFFFGDRSRPLPVGFAVPPAECEGRRLPGAAWLAWNRSRPVRAQRGGEGVCACSGNSNIQRHKSSLGSPGATKVGGERRVLLPQSSASEGQDSATRAWHPL